MNIGEKVIALRTQRALTQKQLAEAAGITRTALSSIESGKSNPLHATLYRLAVALGVTVADLRGEPSELFEREAYKKGALYAVIEQIIGENPKRYADSMESDKGLLRALTLAAKARLTKEQNRDLARAVAGVTEVDEGPAIKIRSLEDQGAFAIACGHARHHKYSKGEDA